MSTKFQPCLRPGVIYTGDNGRLLCIECAGASATYTGHDLSGDKVEVVPYSDTIIWRNIFGYPISCECGRTIYLLPDSIQTETKKGNP